MIRLLKQYRAKRLVAGDLARLYANEAHGQFPPSWRNQSEEYQEYFLESLEVMAGLEVLSEDADMQAAVSDSSMDTTPLQRENRRTWPMWAMAATVLMAVIVGFDAWRTSIQSPEEDVNVLRYLTRIGEQKSVDLVDGSTITLNTGTELLVEISGSQRKLTLRRGEAYFNVARDEARPFTVNTGLRSVTVLGTEFNLLKGPDSLKLAVVDGMVAIHPAEDVVKSVGPLLETSSDHKSTVSASVSHRISAGTVVEYYSEDDQLIAFSDPNIKRLQQWRNGLLRFEDEPLYKVVRELNRYSPKKILIEDDTIMNMKIFALVNLNQLDRALLGLETSMPIKVVKHFDRIVIVGKQSQP